MKLNLKASRVVYLRSAYRSRRNFWHGGRPLIRYAVCRVQDSGRLRACLSFPYKLEQVRIDDIFVSGAHAVGKSRVDLQGGSFHNFRRHMRGDSDRHDLIVVAVHDERWHIELLEIFSKIG